MAAVGLVGGTDIPVTVFPFILNDVNLLGLDSVEISHERRSQLWQRLAGDWHLPQLESLATEVQLDQVPELLQGLLQGNVQGRTLVKLD